MSRYPLTVRENHLLVDFDGQTALIDTGSPVTVATEGLRIDDRPWRGDAGAFVASEIWRRAPAYISERLDHRIDALVGMDVLRDYCFRADFEANEFLMNREPMGNRGTFYPLDGEPRPLIMTVQLRYGNGQSMRAHVDTGAKQSFILARHAAEWPAVGRVADFSPFIGEFTAVRHRIPVQIASKEFTLDFAVMPQFYETSGMMVGAGAVLGNDMWDHFEVTYAPPENGLWLAPRSSHPTSG